MKCNYCGEKMLVEDDVSGDIWISCPKIVSEEMKPSGSDHELYLVTRDNDGKIVIG